MMRMAVKREPLASISENTPVKNVAKRRRAGGAAAEQPESAAAAMEMDEQGATERRAIRSRYLRVKNIIQEEKEDLYRVDSDTFETIISEVEDLYQKVQKPREQVADAEALLGIANTLVTTVRSHSKEGITPSDFVTSMIKLFGNSNRRRNVPEEDCVPLQWNNIGLFVKHIFKDPHGCCTMVGPMKTELKQRKAIVHRKRARPTETARPEELKDNEKEVQTNTDKNMSTMFNILRKDKRVQLEKLILNRRSFAQTVENLFALSFLVKDGRTEISVDKRGNHLVSPRNAPASNLVTSGEVVYNHFVFRFDFKDWTTMKDAVATGDELMPHRN